MKTKMTVSVLIFALLLVFGNYDYHAFAKSPEEPILFLPETTCDFGEIHEGEVVRHMFIIKNKGTASLKIIDVKTD